MEISCTAQVVKILKKHYKTIVHLSLVVQKVPPMSPLISI